MDFGQMKLHIRDVLFKGGNTHLISPTIVIRSGLFQVISGSTLMNTDIKVCSVTNFELSGGFLGNRWQQITEKAMWSWKEYCNVKKPKNSDK